MLPSLSLVFDEAVFYGHNGVVVLADLGRYFVAYQLFYLPFRERIFVRHDEVENEVGVRRTFHHSEVVHRESRVNFLYQLADLFAQGVYMFVINDYRIHMQDNVYGEFLLYVALDAVYGVVARHYVAVGRHFDMGGGEHSARSVVMNHEVMDADNALV